MKTVAIISALLLAGVAASPSIAKEPALEVFLSAGDQTMTTSGETPAREASTYLLRMPSDLPINFSVMQTIQPAAWKSTKPASAAS